MTLTAVSEIDIEAPGGDATELRTAITALVDVGAAGGVTKDADAEARGVGGVLRNWLAATGDLDARALQNAFGEVAPYLPRAFTGSQSGTTVTATTTVFQKGDEGRLIVFANGDEAVIRTINTTDPTTVNSCTVDRSQTVSSQTARIQAKGPVLVHQGDSISYEFFIRLLTKMFRAYGFGGYVVSPLADLTQSRIGMVTMTGGAAQGTDGSQTVFPQAGYFSLPSGGTITFSVGQQLYLSGVERSVVFDLMPEECQTDTAVLIWERAAGAFTVERRRFNEKAWEAVETVADTSTGAQVYGRRRYKHALGNWEYRVTGTSGTVKFVACCFWNRTVPGFAAWSWSYGGTAVTTANTMPSATLKELTDLINPDLRTYLYADYGQVIGAGQTMAQALAASAAQWDAAAPRMDTYWFGMWTGTGSEGALDRDAVRAFALSRGDAYTGFRDIFKDYTTEVDLGLLRDGVHQTRKGRAVTAAIVERVAGFLSSPHAKESRDVNAKVVAGGTVLARGRDLLADSRKGRAKASLKDRGASWLSANCELSGPALASALDVGDFTYAIKTTIPSAANPDVSIGLISTGTGNGNYAGQFSLQFSGGALRLGMRNGANDSNYSYSVSNISARYEGQTGWLYIRSNRARDTFEVFFDTEKATDNGCPVAFFQSSGPTPLALPAWTGLGTNLVITQGAAASVPVYGVMLWRTALSDAEIFENVLADRFTTTVPDVFLDFSEQAGRQVLDQSGNRRHYLFLRSGTNRYLINGGPTWLAGDKRRGLAPPVSADSQVSVLALPNEEIVSNHSSLQTITLPAAPQVGERVRVVGKGAGKWKLAQAAGHQIVEGAGGTVGTNATTAGTGGSVTAANRYDSIELECVTSDSVTPSYVWVVVHRLGAPAWV